MTRWKLELCNVVAAFQEHYGLLSGPCHQRARSETGPNRLPTNFVTLNNVGAIADYRFILLSFIRLSYIWLRYK